MATSGISESQREEIERILDRSLIRQDMADSMAMERAIGTLGDRDVVKIVLITDWAVDSLRAACARQPRRQ